MSLQEILARKRIDIENELLGGFMKEMERKAFSMPKTKNFYSALAVPGLSVIAEVKKASPSKGVIAQDFDCVRTALEYKESGAEAISVLTERHYFYGSDNYLKEIKELVTVPVLRKDFIIDERQIVESRAIGADAILLIAAILDDKKMRSLYALASEYGLHCLFEAHNEYEVKRTADCGAKIIGINNRNLQTFQVDLTTFAKLRKFIPSGTLAVAESGISSVTDAEFMRQSGADAILVGETLMRTGDPGAMIRAFKGEHRCQ